MNTLIVTDQKQERFGRVEGRWRLDAVQAISLADIPPQHRVSDPRHS